MTTGLFVLDTSILLHYARWDNVAKEVERNFGLSRLVLRPMICEVSIGEMKALMLKRGWGSSRIQRMTSMLSALQVLDISSDIIYQTYAQMDFLTQCNGRKMGKNDLWIAATTSVAGATLLTADKDFDALAGTLLNRILIDTVSGVALKI